jgi:hypothetical protein
MRSWSPVIRHQEKAPRKLRAWKIASDGPFWGGVLSVLVWFSVCGYVVVMLVIERRGG